MNGHRLNTISPSISQEGIFGVLRGQISKRWEKTAGPIQTNLCAIYSDGSGNGHMLKTNWPSETQGGAFFPRLIGGNIRGFRGSTFHQKSGYDMHKKIKL